MQGTQFDFTYAPGTTENQIIGFELAGTFWSQYLTDNMTVNIHVEMTDNLPEDVIGGALPAIEDNIEYSDYRTNLTNDITGNIYSGVDSLVDRNQQNESDKFTAYFASQYGSDGYKVDNNQYINMTRANAKALDLVSPYSRDLDGYILMRDLDGVDDAGLNDVRWNYNYGSNSVASNKLDFLSVAIHEIGHTLGFISGLDQADWLAQRRNLNSGNEDDFYSDLVGNLNNATPMDMLRFSRESYQKSGSGENWIDMSVGGSPYLSFNGSGGTPVAYFSTGVDQGLGGDGSQASHWKQQDNALGIMDPVLRTGQRREITNLDRELFDAIGWNISSSGRIDWDDLEDLYEDLEEDAEDAVVKNRTENVNQMINSSVVYNGRRGRGSSGGRWQTALWQHIMFQTVGVEVELSALQSEFKVAEILIENYISQTNNGSTAENNLDRGVQINNIESNLEVEEVAAQLIENREEVFIADYSSLDLNQLGSLLSTNLEDIFEV